MAQNKSCACTGIRCCLRCENKADKSSDTKYNTFVCCYLCGKVKQRREVITCGRRPPLLRCGDTCGKEISIIDVKRELSPDIETITVYKDFLSAEEESKVVKEVDTFQWVPSQSGRNKQDFGPKVNFKRQKVKQDLFSGLPSFSQPLVKRVQQLEGLVDFVPVELCNLEYVPERGSSIDPHLDDSWLWGNRLVTINLLSDTYLTFTDNTKQLLVPLLRYSLVIVSGGARHCWKHSINREHIETKRSLGNSYYQFPLLLLASNVMEPVYCFKHCSSSVSVFYHKNKFPSSCPVCKLPLENVSFLLDPFCVPSPFWNGEHIPSVSLLLKPIPSSESHHIGIVTPCNQRVHHYDTGGITWDHLIYENSLWSRAIVITFSSPTPERLCSQAIANLTDQAAWSSERYDEEHHNCLDFVVTILSSIFSGDYNRHTLSQLMSSHVTRARAHQRLCSLLAENAGVCTINAG